MSLAAPCCGGNFAFPTFIIGDERVLLSTSFAQTTPQTEVSAQGLWSQQAAASPLEIFTLNSAVAFGDRWQTGLSLPIVDRVHLGDLAWDAAYEYLSDLNYDPYLPKAIAFVQLVTPTGRSVYESETDFATDVTGRGFYTAGIGTVLTKVFSQIDIFANLDIHHSWAQTSDVFPGYGGNGGFGLGFNLQNLRIGGMLNWSYEDPIELRHIALRGGPSLSRWTTGTVSLSYLWSPQWAATVSYADQTVFGSPLNTGLSKTVLFAVQYKILR